MSTIRARVEHMMREQELFRDEKLDIRILAERLDLSNRQVAEALNLNLGSTFTAYVNRLRVSAARRDLRAHPKRSLLNIAKDCGFRSRSTFNTAFFREIGETPSVYRKRVTERE